MYKILYILTLAGFFALPPSILSLRFTKPKLMSWWLAILVISIGGWLLVNATIYFYYEHLSVLIETQDNPPLELVDKWAADGAKRVFGLLFGWLYSLLYSMPYILIYMVVYHFRKRTCGI